MCRENEVQMLALNAQNIYFKINSRIPYNRGWHFKGASQNCIVPVWHVSEADLRMAQGQGVRDCDRIALRAQCHPGLSV